VIGVIGGSGLYTLLDDVEEVTVPTPYGAPSDPVVVGRVGGTELAFLPRHGRDHRFPPHLIPYRANLWALRELGVRQVLAPCAVGGLDPALSPGDLVVPDQLLDRTSGRPATYYDEGAVHVPFADPYCPHGRRVSVERATDAGWPVTTTGTLAVIDGPRFSTRAESRAMAAAGATVVNMTAMPEAVLARELALCFVSLALVTDRDAGVEVGESVRMDEVMRVFAAATERMKDLLVAITRAWDGARDCDCAGALTGTPADGRLPD
jgi:5'-methylthioadenosine phosphorylase